MYTSMTVHASANQVTIISYYTPWDNSYNSETECPLFTLSSYYATIISLLSHYYLTIIRPIISTYYTLLSVSILLYAIILPIIRYYIKYDILYSLSLEMCAKLASAFAHQSGKCARFVDCALCSTNMCASWHAQRRAVWPYGNIFGCLCTIMFIISTIMLIISTGWAGISWAKPPEMHCSSMRNDFKCNAKLTSHQNSAHCC